MVSLIWSAILSGWPSVTDSEVKRRRGTRFSLGSTAGAWERALDKTLPGGPGRQGVQPSGRALRGRDAPHGGGNGVLAAARDLGDGPVGGEHHGGVVGAAERLPRRDVVDDEQV